MGFLGGTIADQTAMYAVCVHVRHARRAVVVFMAVVVVVGEGRMVVWCGFASTEHAGRPSGQCPAQLKQACSGCLKFEF